MNLGRVPCDGCTHCCKNELLVLHPEMGDRPEQYETQQVKNPITGQQVFALKQKPNGDCIYLGDDGCTIHGKAPAICREFDCRALFIRAGSRNERRRLLKTGLLTKHVLKAGRIRIHTLEA